MYSRWPSPSLHHRAAHNRSGITYSWSIFPGIKEEWNESSGRRRGGHFGGRGEGRNRCCEEGRREKEVETEREKGERKEEGKEKSESTPSRRQTLGYRDCAAATLSIIHLAPGPMYADHYPIPDAGATGNSCSHANSPVRGRSTSCCLLFLSFSSLCGVSFPFSFLVLFPVFLSLYLFLETEEGEGRALPWNE